MRPDHGTQAHIDWNDHRAKLPQFLVTNNTITPFIRGGRAQLLITLDRDNRGIRTR